MNSARWPQKILPTFFTLGLALSLLPTVVLAQSDPSPSDAQNSAAQKRSEAIELENQPPSVRPRGSTVPVPLPVDAIQPAAAQSTARFNDVRSSDKESVDEEPGASSEKDKPLAATSSDETSRRLQTIVIQAIDNLDASRLPQREQAIPRLESAVTRLENYINLNSSNGQAWSQFLRLEALKKELSSKTPRTDTLEELELNMRQNYVGLELAPYQEVRRGINELVRALRYGGQPERTVEQLEAKLTQLVEDLNKPIEDGGSKRSLEVGLIANYLHEMNQAPMQLGQIQQQFSSPNVQIYAQERLVNRLLVRSVSEPSPVNECLLGTRVIGRACLQGAVNVDVLPMVSGISMQLNLNATVTTRNSGYNRGVVLGTTSSSPVSAAKQIFITPAGISSGGTNVATNLQTSINSIDHRLRIVRRIAKRKAAEQKPLADSIAEGRLQNRIRTQYDEQVSQQLAAANVRFASLQSQSPPELARLDIPRPQLNFYSTSDALHANVKQASPFQLAAHRPSTLAKPQSSDVVAEVHQSALTNALDIVLGGRTIRSADLDDYAKQATGSVPEELKKEADGEAWSITLANYRPVDIQFDESHVTIKLRVVRMTRGAQMLNENAIVTAVYDPRYENGVLTLTRQGEVDVNFVQASRGVRSVALRSFLKGKFDRFFKEQFVTQSLHQLPLPVGAPRFEIDAIQVDDGWIQVGVR